MNASRRALASKAPAGASSTALPVVIHGKRTIKAGMVEEFRRHYDAYSKAMFERPGIKAVYAFADKNDPLSYWHVTFASDTASFDAARALVAQSDAAVQLASTYTAPNDDDTLVLPPHVTTTRDAQTVPGASRLLLGAILSFKEGLRLLRNVALHLRAGLELSSFLLYIARLVEFQVDQRPELTPLDI